MKPQSSRWLAAFLIAASMLTGARAASSAEAAVMVFAAASLADVAKALAADFAEPGRASPTFVHAGSSALARQIEKGAPADIFISADELWMDYLQSRNLIAAGTRTDVVGNTLVLIAPRAHPATLDIVPGVDLSGILGDGRLALADPNSVPAGRYAKAALETLGIWSALEARLIRADSVRAALVFVERGEAPAGIVYATDAAASDRVMVADRIPAALHPPIVYPMAIVTGHKSAAVNAVYEYLRSDAAKSIYARFGFTVP